MQSHFAAVLLLLLPMWGAAAPLTPAAQVGKQMFFDKSLSASGQLACASCHDPEHAHAAPNKLSVQLGGARMTTAGVRAVPSLRYQEYTPPYADLLDLLTRCRVKMLNDLFDFESKLTVDEVEDELREAQNSHFIEGRAVHSFEEITAILDFMPAGYESDDEKPAKSTEEDDDLPELDEAEEEKLKNDESLKWDDDEESDGDEEKKAKSDDDEESGEDEDKPAKVTDEDEKPPRRSRGKR